jgi:hypothetical protein
LAIALGIGVSVLAPLAGATASPAGAVTAAAPTTSYYEQDASATNLYLQGQTAGQAGMQGIVILDFGRPASDGTNDGTLDFGRTFVSFANIVGAVQNFIIAYYNYAPANTTIDVAVGTNDSCGLFQPCGAVICGCPNEPSNYITWGHELAAAVMALRAWSTKYGAANSFTDTVRVAAADDAEPAFDPGYYNTYDVMEGYAQAVGGSVPPMVDYGSAEPGFWTEDQLLQIANGFAPNVAMPEIYSSDQVNQWANLVAYANTSHNEAVTIYGVLTTAGGTVASPDAVAQMLGAVAGISGQSSIPWVSDITD